MEMITGRIYRLNINNGSDDNDYYLIKLDNGNYLVIWKIFPSIKDGGCIVYTKKNVESNINSRLWEVIELSDEHHESFVSHSTGRWEG